MRQSISYLLFSVIGLLLFLPLVGVVDFSAVNALGSFVMFYLISSVGIIATHHRHFSHKSFEFDNKPLKAVCMFLGALGLSGSALQWSITHKQHHRYTDTDKDPHHSAKGIWELLKLDYGKVDKDIYKQAIKDPMLVWFHRNGIRIVSAWALVLLITGGISLVYYMLLVPAVLTIVISVLTAYATHYNSEEQDLWWVSLINGGEGQHIVHHKNPHLYHTAEDLPLPYTDFAGFLIKHILRRKYIKTRLQSVSTNNLNTHKMED